MTFTAEIYTWTCRLEPLGSYLEKQQLPYLSCWGCEADDACSHEGNFTNHVALDLVLGPAMPPSDCWFLATVSRQSIVFAWFACPRPQAKESWCHLTDRSRTCCSLKTFHSEASLRAHVPVYYAYEGCCGSLTTKFRGKVILTVSWSFHLWGRLTHCYLHW